MEKLRGEKIHVLPFKDIKKVEDLIYYDGPILSHFSDSYGKHLIFYWVDLDDKKGLNRWLVFQVEEAMFYKYLLKSVSLKNLIESPVNDIFYTTEIGQPFQYTNVFQIFREDLNEKYIPEEDSFYEAEISDKYSHKLAEYQASFLKETWLMNAACVKAEPDKKAKSRNYGAVDILNGGALMLGYGNAYKGLLNYEIRKEFYKRDIIDEKRVRKAIRQENVKSLLNLVGCKAASFGIAFVPNNFSDSSETFLGKEWRDKVFVQFKNDIIEIDKKTEEEVDQLVKIYGEDYVNDIYEPIIRLYNNKNIEIKITDKDFQPTRTVARIRDSVVKKLIRTKDASEEEPIDRLARVKQNPITGKITTSHATLFDQSIQTSWGVNEIRTEKKVYKLKHKLFAEYRLENSINIIEHEELNIYATGEHMSEAETDFSNQFHEIYQSLFTKENKDLSAEEIEVKNVLNFFY